MTGDFATLMTWADKGRKLKIRTNADTPGRRREGPRVRRRRHRPVPHRAHVLRRGPHRRGARDDPRHRRRRAARRRSRRSSRSRRPTSSASSRRWTAARSRSACSTRRCTSSCRRRTTSQAPRRSPSRSASTVEKVFERVDELHEMNPMMGFRGCRLPVVFPEIGDMQVRAIIEAAIEVQEEGQEGAARDHDPARRRRRGTDDAQEAGHRGRRGVHEEGRGEGRVPDRHDDRTAARVPRRRTRSPRRPSSSASAPTT